MNTWLVTSAFCKADLLEDLLEFVYSTPPKTKFTHIICDNHYPIDKENNRQKIKELSEEFGCHYIDSGRDLGLHRGINNAMMKAGVLPGDILVGLDPDDRPQAGFLDTMKAVMQAQPSLAVLCTSFSVIYQKMGEGVPFKPMMIAGHPVMVHPSIEMWNVAAFNTHFLNDIGGISQPNAYYGGIEVDLYRSWQKRGMFYGYLAGVTSEAVPVNRADTSLFDPQYRQWKTDHVNGYKKSFEEWLLEKRGLVHNIA